MFELIKVILENIIKLIDPQKISSMRKAGTLRRVGTRLYLFYAHLNETIICGHEILVSLESYLESTNKTYGTDSFAPEPHYWIKNHLEELIAWQTRNLVYLWANANELSEQLIVLDAEVYRRLHALVHAKSRSLNSLLSTLKNKSLPVLGPSTDYLESQSPNKLELENVRYFQIPTKTQWTEEIYLALKAYEEERRPRQQLKEIEELTDKLRRTLEENFEISDVLLEIGDSPSKEFYPVKFYLDET